MAVTDPVEPTFLEVGFFIPGRIFHHPQPIFQSAGGKNDSKNKGSGFAPDAGGADGVLFPENLRQA